MKIPAIFCLLAFLPAFMAQDTLLAQEATYPSLASEVLTTYQPAAPEKHTPQAMAAAATKFLAALTPELRKQAALAFDSKEKARWTNTPPRGEQGGVRIGDLDKAQLKLACDLLRAVMSERGYASARNVPLADDTLLRNGQPRPGFGAENYWLAIFGEPSATDPWALQFDGHHIAINLAFHGERMCMSPSFLGTQPAAFDFGGKQIEIMQQERALSYAFMKALGEEQRKEVIVSDRRMRLVAAAGRDGRVPEPVGAKVSDLDKADVDRLFEVIHSYSGLMPPRYAKQRLKALRAEVDQMTVAWGGPTAPKSDMSYRIQSPSLIIEYAGQDLGRDPLNHIHGMYRDPSNEYGAALGGEE